MKIKNINNIPKFFEIIGNCHGRVELVTSNGDRLNLKSALSKIVVVSSFFKTPEIGEIEIMFSDDRDIATMMDFLVRG